jgi:DNA-binding winged helix-turn-helix (wHTH) protein/TolB-like protein
VDGPVRFGLFEFDADTGALSREGVPVRLQPQPARVLAILLTHAGDVVTRDTLRQEVWSDGTFVDFERGLNFCVAQIRSALGDAADSPRFIETLPRRGYRFIAPIHETRSQPERRAKSVARSGFYIPALIGLTLVTAALVVGAWRAASEDARVRIAVVPFDNETGMEEFDRIARGVADATVARLSTPERVAAFSVIGNAAALQQPRAFRDLKRIGTELGADYIVLAQMKRDDAGVRLIAHLIRVRDQSHLWANTYDRAVSSPERVDATEGFTLAAQAEIAEAIAAEVAKTLAKASSRRA